MPRQYILFCAQEANFQTRSMLIPMDKFSQCDELVLSFNILRDHAEPYTFVKDHENIYVDNLLKIDVPVWNSTTLIEPTIYDSIVHELTHLADGMDDVSVQTKIWYDETITNLCKGFDHVRNYHQLRNMTSYKGKEIDVIEGFLILENRV